MVSKITFFYESYNYDSIGGSMKAQFQSTCLFCTGKVKKGQEKILVGQEIARHPNAPGKWVHAWHLEHQVPLFK